MYNLSIHDFDIKLASAEPVPGGGGASALMGAVASSLCSMVANLTTGKKKYEMYQEDIEAILIKTTILTKEIEELINKDAEAFEPLAKAYSISKETEDRDLILEDALQIASKAPMDIILKMKEVALIIEELSLKGSKLAISDVAVAACACIAAAKGASMNVYINTKLMKNKEYAEDMNTRCDNEVQVVTSICEKAYKTVYEGLR